MAGARVLDWGRVLRTRRELRSSRRRLPTLVEKRLDDAVGKLPTSERGTGFTITHGDEGPFAEKYCDPNPVFWRQMGHKAVVGFEPTTFGL